MPKNTLMRTCTSCGIEKPISAFLQLSGTQGTTYGSICATCRSREARTAKVPVKDDSSTSSTGQRIGAKEKAYMDKINQQRLEDKDALKTEGRKQDYVKREELDKKIIKEQAEKDHRKNYVESKPEFWIGKKLPKGHTLPFAQKETPLASKNKTDLKGTDKEKLAQIKKLEQDAQKEEIQKVATDFSALHHPIQGGRLEVSGLPFLSFIEGVLTHDAPIKKMLNQFYKKHKPPPQEKPETRTEEQKQEQTAGFIRKHWSK